MFENLVYSGDGYRGLEEVGDDDEGLEELGKDLEGLKEVCDDDDGLGELGEDLENLKGVMTMTSVLRIPERTLRALKKSETNLRNSRVT